MKKIALTLLVFAGALFLSAPPVSAITLTFEDFKLTCDSSPHPPIPQAPYSCVITNGYSGMNWDNFNALDSILNCNAAGHTTDGEVKGTVSGSICLFNPWGKPASILTTAPIVLHSAYLTGAWRDGMSLQADGYRAGALVYSKSIIVSAYSPTLVSYEFNNVDKVVWTSNGGTNAGYGADGTQFAMDNLSYDLVPEPSSILALLCGIGGIGGVMLRKKSV